MAAFPWSNGHDQTFQPWLITETGQTGDAVRRRGLPGQCQLLERGASQLHLDGLR
jgi:hypothetical protein